MENKKAKCFSELKTGDTIFKVTIDSDKSQESEQLVYTTAEYTVTREPYHPQYVVDLCVPYKDNNGDEGELYIPQISQNSSGAYINKHILYMTDDKLLGSVVRDLIVHVMDESLQLSKESSRIMDEILKRMDFLKALNNYLKEEIDEEV